MVLSECCKVCFNYRGAVYLIACEDQVLHETLRGSRTLYINELCIFLINFYFKETALCGVSQNL